MLPKAPTQLTTQFMFNHPKPPLGGGKEGDMDKLDWLVLFVCICFGIIYFIERVF